MRKSCKALGALMAVVMIVTMFSSTIFAGVNIVASGSNSAFDWVLYDNNNLTVKLTKSSYANLSLIDSVYLSAAKSITIDFSGYLYNASYSFYDSGSNAESITFTGCDDCSIDKISLYNFENLKGSAVTLPSGSDISTLFFSSCGFSKIDFLGNNDVKTLNVTNCSNLTSIDLKNKVENLRVQKCEQLTGISNTDALIDVSISLAPSLKSMSIPKNLKSMSLNNCGFEEISIPKTLNARVSGEYLKKAIIEPGREKTVLFMFENARALEEVILPEGLTVIQYGTFASCKSLKNVNLPSTVETIGQSAFNSAGLTSITLPNGLKAIRAVAFAFCEDLKTVYLPSSVKEITVNAFDFDSITDVYYSGSEEQWNKISVLTAPYGNNDDLTLKKVFGDAKIHFNYVATTGWVKNNGDWYYYDANGVMAKGWKSIDGMWFYFDASGVMSTGWVQSGGKWYYMDPTLGAMVTGWKQINGKWYCFDNSGVMQTGWVGSGSTWYYLDSSGAMTKGWLDYKGKWYYFNDNGVMVTGWKQVSGKYYYFDNSGAMVTGWKQISGSYYYFKSNGAMASNEYCEGYFLNPDGTWTYKYKAIWRQNSKGWWFGDDSGWYAKNRSLTINGKVYEFDADGYCKNP